MLARSPLTLAELNRDATLAHMSSHGPIEFLFFCSLEHMVVFEIPAKGIQIFKVLFFGAFVGFLKKVIFDLATYLSMIPPIRQTSKLVFKHTTRGNGDRFVAWLGLQIADDQGRFVEPGDQAQSF